jgi:hypothetical protein
MRSGSRVLAKVSAWFGLGATCLVLVSCKPSSDTTDTEPPPSLAPLPIPAGATSANGTPVATPPPAPAQTPAPTVAEAPASTGLQPAPLPPELAASTPEPTPFPARGAQMAAIQMYPDLAKQGSVFNMMFRDMFNQKRATNPAFLQSATWPIDLAREVASTLGVSPASSATPTPEATPMLAAQPTAPPQPTPGFDDSNNDNPLDKPAYDQHHDQYHGYWVDIYGYRHYY